MKVLAFVFCFLAFTAESRASAPLREKFRATFHEFYKPGRCGENIARLLRAAIEDGIDVSHAQVGVITNEGYFFSVTHRRNSGPLLPAPENGHRFAPGISNFFHHVILESEGEIYDYDFGNEPRPVSLKSYIKGMFWDEPADTKYTGLERLSERRKYKLTFVGAKRYLEQMSADGGTSHRLGALYEILQLPSFL